MATTKNNTKRMSITNLIKLAQADPRLAEQMHNEQQASGAIKAFGKFQQALQPAPKRGVVDYWSKKKHKYVTVYKYVYFDDLKKVVNNAMQDTGLIWRQTPDNCTTTRVPMLDKYGKPTGQMSIGEVVGIKTVISYKNGYPFKTGYMRTVSTTTNPQDVGSAMTYCKRYSLATAVGISTTPDIDGKQQAWGGQRQSQAPQTPLISNDQVTILNHLINKSTNVTGVPATGVYQYLIGEYSTTDNIKGIPSYKFGEAKAYVQNGIMNFVSKRDSEKAQAKNKSDNPTNNSDKAKGSTANK